jgi:mannosylglycerate hydrolase MGH1-like protein
MNTDTTAEGTRLQEDAARNKNWKRWGPYLSERQWGTVREDYSPDGAAWHYFPHEHARSRAYRWGEDGLFGITDRQCRLCFALALWNGKDPILKERLFGLTGPQGNHGEDVKELYYYLDATPTSSYLRGLYKYPQREFPYQQLVSENGRRGKDVGEFELADTGALDEGRYFDVQVEYAKASPEDILVRITVSNRGGEAAELALLPTLWFRNHWGWGRTSEEHGPKPEMHAEGASRISATHAELGAMELALDSDARTGRPELLFTDNETNVERLWSAPNPSPFVKDAFHDHVVAGRREAVNPAQTGTKAAGLYRLRLEAGESVCVRLRLREAGARASEPFDRAFEDVFRARIAEADAFYAERIPAVLTPAERAVARQAYAGLLWSKQFYHYVVPHWLEGDPSQPAPPGQRKNGRNSDWAHLYNRDLISMPDKWEYPWYAAWDLAFHMLPFARIDPDFAKAQLELFLREWYMHPNGQIPAYEWALSDVNPPVHAWAAWRVYKKSARAGERDVDFLKRVFHKLLLNFNWWVNRKDRSGKHIFAGGFLGLDNIGVFDRSAPLPSGGALDQADGTAWMAFYCGTMLSIALELARHDTTYEDLASKFFEHYVSIVDAMNSLGGTGLWDERDGFYYDELHMGGEGVPLRVRSLVGLIPLIAVEILEKDTIAHLPGFQKRMQWFLENRKDLARHIGYMECQSVHDHELLSIPSRERLERVLARVLDEREFLSPFGIRSLSRVHEKEPYVLTLEGTEYRVDYAPGEGTTALFGGNSNWRGPIWFPINILLVEALERYAHFYGDELKVECPTGSGTRLTLHEVALELATRLTRLFLPDASGARPCHGGDARYRDDPHWKDLVLFHEYFHAETGRGVGASHQTGWTALVASLLEGIARVRCEEVAPVRRTEAEIPMPAARS